MGSPSLAIAKMATEFPYYSRLACNGFSNEHNPVHLVFDISESNKFMKFKCTLGEGKQFLQRMQKWRAWCSESCTPRSGEGFTSRNDLVSIPHTQPQVCSLLRHDSFQFVQNLNLKSQACAATQQYISNQAAIGERQLRADAKRRCVDSQLASGKDTASSLDACADVSGYPMRDLSKGIQDAQVQGFVSQRALKAMLTFVSEMGSYDFISSLVGEIEIASNGQWQPLWPKSMLKPNQVSSNYIRTASDMICSDLRPILAGNAFLNSEKERTVAKTIQRHLTYDDADAIESLFDKDRRLACNALGRSVGVLSVKQTLAKSSSVMAAALTNGALPAALRDEYRARASNAFEALERSLNAEQVPELSIVQNQVQDLARYMRFSNRKSAARLSSARSENQKNEADDNLDCFDTKSCQ